MRKIIFVLLALMAMSPATAQEEQWVGDTLLACLVGNGVVAMRNGANAEDAFTVARLGCEAESAAMEPVNGDEDEGDWGDSVEYILGIARNVLIAAEDIPL